VFSGLLFISLGGLGLAFVWPLGWSVGKVVLAWSSITLISMGLSYGFLGPRLLCKRSDGRIGWMGRFLFGPFFFFNEIRFRSYWFLTKEKPWHEVSPGIFLGRVLCETDRAVFSKLGVVGVLDLTAEFQEARFVGEETDYRCVPILDTRAANPETLEQCVDWLQEHLERGPVYIHCAMGHGRSALIVAALLLARGTVKDCPRALVTIRKERSRARLHLAQQRAIEHWLTARRAV